MYGQGECAADVLQEMVSFHAELLEPVVAVAAVVVVVVVVVVVACRPVAGFYSYAK